MQQRGLIKIACPEFDLAMTLDSGQVFHWRPHGVGFLGCIDQEPVYVEQRSEMLYANRAASPRLAHYFSLDHPLHEICAALPNDPAMTSAREYCRGLRIIRQPLWECLATFITSSMKQVAHIRQMSAALRERFSAPAMIYGTHVYPFPPAFRLAEATEAALRGCALGYRAKNLRATAQLVAGGAADLEAWRGLPDDALRARLCELPGVGAKIANCVMLFAYERLRAFPIDVWIERALRTHYFPRARKLSAARLRDFCEGYFGVHGGYAQQYLFHHARKTAPRRGARP